MPRVTCDPSPPSALRQRREALGYSLRSTGLRAHLPYRRIWELEQGASIRKHETYALAAALCCSLDELRVLHSASHPEAGNVPDDDVTR